MKKEELCIKSNQDGLNLSTTIYIPKKEIKGIVQISHGMSEHKERYYNFMNYLTNKGYITIINDHRGHGKSIKEEKDLGYFYDNTGTYIVEDLHQITLYIKERFPNKKLILFGHSMGSLVVRNYIKKYDKDIDKLIVCGSPSKNNLVDIALILTNIIEKITNNKYRSKLLNILTVGSYNKGNKKNSWLCTDSSIVKEYNQDKLCGYTFTVNGFKNLFKLLKETYSKQNWNLQNKKLPILFIAGSKDPVIVNKNKWYQSINFLSQIGYKNIKSKLYKNLKHELLNEINKEEIYLDILNYIEDIKE